MEEWLLRGKELWVLVSGWGREDEQEKMAKGAKMAGEEEA